ncbi:MAG: AAA family ATPase [Planctomycetota bacterium]
MRRKALEYLRRWVGKHHRRPLIVRGARQVGKSHLVRQLAGTVFENLLEINLEVDADAASLFESKKPKQILGLLQVRYGKAIEPGKTLLFLDEIQASPEVLSCLRYFHEEMPELHVIAAGSLLDFALRDPNSSMPVGRIEYLHLGPMDFEEFLTGLGLDHQQSFLENYLPGDDIPSSLHAELMRRTRQFFQVGGMPASLASFVRTGVMEESEEIRQNLLSTYRDDFGKYGRQVDRRRLEKVFNQIPLLVGSKFMYSRVDREERSKDLGHALDLLTMARVVSRVRHSSSNGVPLGAEASERRFKMLFLDVGLLCRSSGLGLLDFEGADDVTLINAGAVCEQFIGQHLLFSKELYENPELNYWAREQKSSNAEVDYVISIGPKIIPVEVKAGKTGTLKSLHVFLQEKKLSFAIRFNADPPSLLDTKFSTANAPGHPFRLLSLPHYLVCQTRRLCREAINQ